METKCDFMVNRAILIEMGFKPSQAARMIKESKAYLQGLKVLIFIIIAKLVWCHPE